MLAIVYPRLSQYETESAKVRAADEKTKTAAVGMSVGAVGVSVGGAVGESVGGGVGVDVGGVVGSAVGGLDTVGTGLGACERVGSDVGENEGSVASTRTQTWWSVVALPEFG